MKETTYWQRTDSFDAKMQLLQEAYRAKNYRVARSIAEAIVDLPEPGPPVMSTPVEVRSNAASTGPG